MAYVLIVDGQVKKMKDNVKKMQEMMKNWTKPLFERKNKPFAPDDLVQQHDAAIGPRLDDIKTDGKEIHKLMKDTVDHIRPDKKSHTWLAYVDYVNGLIIEGVTIGIEGSMNFLADQINISFNKHHQLLPMFDIRVDLRDRDVCFDPTIGSNSRGNGIKDIIYKIIEDFISISIQTPRLDSGNGDYLVEIKDQFTLFGCMQVISNNMIEIEQATQDFIRQYQDKEFLWKETLEENFEAFLNTGEDPREQKHVILNDDGQEIEDESFEWMANKILVGVETRQPPLDNFDEKIIFLTQVKNEIAEMKTSVDIGWLRVNVNPLIREL